MDILDGFLNILSELYQSICIDRFNLNRCVRLYFIGLRRRLCKPDLHGSAGLNPAVSWMFLHFF